MIIFRHNYIFDSSSHIPLIVNQKNDDISVQEAKQWIRVAKYRGNMKNYLNYPWLARSVISPVIVNNTALNVLQSNEEWKWTDLTLIYSWIILQCRLGRSHFNFSMIWILLFCMWLTKDLNRQYTKKVFILWAGHNSTNMVSMQEKLRLLGKAEL